ncbi:MAG: ArnT family glycosyltransferase [Desulfobacterales bacterium]
MGRLPTLMKSAGVNLKYLVFFVAFLLAVFLRFWNLAIAPYYEWDEPVYTSIGAHVAQTGTPQVKTEIGFHEPYYLYHPPFHFLMLGEWFSRFGSSIEAARILSASLSTLLLVILFFFLITYDEGRDGAALLALFLVGMDGWIVYSNRVAWIENAMMPIGIMGLWVYHSALKAEKAQYWRFITAGILLAAACIYKHVGLYFLLTIPICWLIDGRRNFKAHLALALAGAGVVLIYLLFMYVVYGDYFLQHYQVQIQRTFGMVRSRGVVESLDHLVSAVTGNYRIYAGMMVTALFAGGLFLRKPILAIRHLSMEPLRTNSLLFSCVTAALLFFGSISLKIPHYYFMVLVPLYAFASVEAAELARRSVKWRQAVMVVVPLILLANLVTFSSQFATPPENAGAELRQYFDEAVPEDAVVIAEETTGTLIRQPYLKIGRFQRHLYSGNLDKYRPSYLVTYESITQRPPDNDELHRLIDRSEVLRTFEDFKCKLTVYRIPESLPDLRRTFGEKGTQP